MLYKFKIFYFIFLLAVPLNGQIGENLKNDVKSFFRLGGELYSAPFDFDKKDWINFSIVTGSAAAAYFVEEDLREWIQANRTDFLDDAAYLDDYYLYLGTASAAFSYLYGLIGKNEYVRNLGLQIGEAMLYSGTTTFLIKLVHGRSRPFRNEGHSEFDFFQFDDSKYSFSSGHASLSFAFSTVAAEQLNNAAWKAFWYTAAALVASARVYKDVHWLSDIIVGSAIGYFFGRFVVDFNKREQLRPDQVIPPPMINFSISF